MFLIKKERMIKLTENFSLREFNCNDENQTPVPKELLHNTKELAENLQVLRNVLQEPIQINSSYRTLEWNDKCGGTITSQHLVAKAADIASRRLDPLDIAETIEYLIEIGEMKEGGIGIYNSFIHYDIRGTKARWDFSTK